MERQHGFETYFVEGEGVLGESGAGRPRTLAASVEAAAPPFRFSRMGPSGSGLQLGEANLKKLATAMAAGTYAGVTAIRANQDTTRYSLPSIS